eukprot:15296806-Alexandrium_andersonii.AAC.1
MSGKGRGTKKEQKRPIDLSHFVQSLKEGEVENMKPETTAASEGAPASASASGSASTTTVWPTS